jgi:hypothetical protein
MVSSRTPAAAPRLEPEARALPAASSWLLPVVLRAGDVEF